MISTANTIKEEVQSLLGSFERMTGLQICLRRMSGRWHGLDEGPGRPIFTLHHSEFCLKQKDLNLPQCMRDDRGDASSLFLGQQELEGVAQGELPAGRTISLPVAGSPLGSRPLLRTCHAGADEILVPIWSQGILVAILFLGQFRRQSREQSGPVDLPVLSDERVRQIADLSVMLRCYLLEILHRLDSHRQAAAVGRRGQVEQYIREHLSDGPTLAGLAAVMSLSPSRTSHLVKQLTGQSFQSLVEQRRLAVACDLLAASSGKLAWIAQQTGLGDIGYFCRYFKRKTGMTPTVYRQLHQQQAGV